MVRGLYGTVEKCGDERVQQVAPGIGRKRLKSGAGVVGEFADAGPDGVGGPAGREEIADAPDLVVAVMRQPQERIELGTAFGREPAERFEVEERRLGLLEIGAERLADARILSHFSHV